MTDMAIPPEDPIVSDPSSKTELLTSRPCPNAGRIVGRAMAARLSELCSYGDDCKCKAWRAV